MPNAVYDEASCSFAALCAELRRLSLRVEELEKKHQDLRQVVSRKGNQPDVAKLKDQVDALSKRVSSLSGEAYLP